MDESNFKIFSLVINIWYQVKLVISKITEELGSVAFLEYDETSTEGTIPKKIQFKEKDDTVLYPEVDTTSIIDIIYPIGTLYFSNDSAFNPNVSWTGVWKKLDEDALLKIVTTGAGTYGGSNNTSSGPSTNTTSSTAITVAQMPVHNHNYNGTDWDVITTNNLTQNGTIGSGIYYHSSGVAATILAAKTAEQGNRGGGEGHTHTLSSHTHTINPKYFGTYAWHRVS